MCLRIIQSRNCPFICPTAAKNIKASDLCQDVLQDISSLVIPHCNKGQGSAKVKCSAAGELLLDYIDPKLVYAARIGEKLTHTDMYRVQPALQEESRESIISSHFISAL